jgi:hypothetical protein
LARYYFILFHKELLGVGPVQPLNVGAAPVVAAGWLAKGRLRDA